MTAGSDALKQLDGPRVDTRRALRRAVRIACWDDLAREVERVERASRPPPEGSGVRVTGNWSVGQILDHLARTIERSMDGFGPVTQATPESSRDGTAQHQRKSRMLTLPMSVNGPSVALPGQIDPAMQMWTNDGAARLLGAIKRVRDKHPMDKPSPTLGAMTNAEWETFHLRHAELHLSFVVLGEWR